MTAAATVHTPYLVLSLVQIALYAAGMVLILRELRELVRQVGLVRVALAEHQRRSDERLTRLEEAQPEVPALSLRKRTWPYGQVPIDATPR